MAQLKEGTTIGGVDILQILDLLDIELGRNENGNWVRWNNGLQVCFAFMPELQGTTIGTAMGSLYRSGDITWTYPKPFSHFFYANGNTSGQSWVVTNAGVGRNNTNSMVFRLLRATEGVADRDVWFFAIGWWKEPDIEGFTPAE